MRLDGGKIWYHRRMKTLTRTHIPTVWLLGCLLLGAAGLAAGTFFDQPLSYLLYMPNVFWAKCLAAAIPAPVFWALGAAGFLTIDVLRDTQNSISGWILGFLFLIVGPVYMTNSFMEELGTEWIIAWCIGLLLSTLPALLYAWLMRSASRKDKIRCIWILLIVSVGSMLIVQVLKRVWVRPRPYLVMDSDQVPFVPWYTINRSAKTQFAVLYEMDHDAFRSFPSGHAQSVTCLFLWALIPVFTKKGNENVILTICLIVTLIGMVSRMILGAHYLSDVCAGYLITFLLFSLCCWFFGLTRSHEPMPRSQQDAA